MHHEVRALVFDAYGTLFDDRSVVSVCDEVFPGYGDSLSRCWRDKQLEYTWLLSLMGRYEDFWHVIEKALIFVCREMGLSYGSSAIVRVTDGYLRLETFPDIPAGLGTLSQYQLAILSNGSPAMLKAIVENAGLESAFAQVVSVDEVRVYKPDPRVYQLAARRLGLEQSAIGFVSSNSWDAAGAKSSGLWTCWLNRSGASMDDLGAAPDLTIGRLSELADILHP